MRNLSAAFLLLFAMTANAQVKIGDNPNTINSNSLLEMESTNKGFLPPRVALNSLTSVSPLTGTVPSGMLVFSTGGSLTNGYYYWNGAQWVRLAGGETNMVVKTATTTLLKTETFVLASNDITLTLPVITSADDGLSITVKNIGTFLDLVVVLGNAGAVIDDGALIALPRWFSLTMTAKGGNWYFKERTIVPVGIIEVSPYSSWQTLDEAIQFLGVHMWGPTVIKLGNGTFDIAGTQTINLPYSLTIQGASYSTTTLSAASGLANKPMFRCVSECYFKMLQFDATTLTNYGTLPGEDAIRFVGNDTYNEIKDCNFDRFYNTILDSTNAELWIFETDINNAQENGILLHSAVAGVVLKIAETDFIGCKHGVNFSKGNAATVQLASGGYYNSSATDTAIVYRPTTFTSYTTISITGNSWNSTGRFIEGFDYTRTDGRDAAVKQENNAGIGDAKPKCFINVVNSVTTTTLTTGNIWYKINWGTNTSSETTKWTINDNKITFQSTNKRNGWMIISGNVSASANAQNITVAIVKNGVTTTLYGPTTIRTTTVDQPFPFTIIVNLSDIAQNDYFELYARNETSAAKTVMFQDLQWIVNTQ
ncbi:MAG: hypothetical protein ABIT05_08965 [Chitinophagaceae bacterium]